MAVPKRTGRGKDALNKPHGKITDKVMEMARANVPTNQIWNYVLVTYEATAPTSKREFDALYGPVISAAKAETSLKIGKKVIEQATATEGHFPSQALFLESGGEWKKKQETDINLGVDDDTGGAIATLMAMLGKAKENTKE